MSRPLVPSGREMVDAAIGDFEPPRDLWQAQALSHQRGDMRRTLGGHRRPNRCQHGAVDAAYGSLTRTPTCDLPVRVRRERDCTQCRSGARSRGTA